MNAVLTQPPAAEPKTFRDLIQTEKYQRELGKALPNGVTTERIGKLIVSAMNKNPDLLKCTALSMYNSCIECATLNLWPGPQGHIYLIPRNNKVKEQGKQDRWEDQATAMIGYRGMIELAYRSGLVVPGSFIAQPIHENDHFEYEYGHQQRVTHRPKLGERGKVIGAWAGVVPKDGTLVFHVMSVEEIEKVRARSKAKDSGPWVTDWNEMACKTVVRRLWKYLPSSISDKFAEQLERDAEREFDLMKEAEVLNGKPSSRLADNFGAPVTGEAPEAAGGEQAGTKTPTKGEATTAVSKESLIALARTKDGEAVAKLLDSHGMHVIGDATTLDQLLELQKGLAALPNAEG